VSIRRILIMTYYNFLPMLKQPLTIVTVVGYTVVPIIFLYWAFSEIGLVHGLIGAMVVSLAFGGIFLSQDFYYNKQYFKLQDFLVASPLKSHEYIIGISLSGFILGIPVLIPALYLINMFRPTGILENIIIILILAVAYITMTFIGFVLGTCINNPTLINGLSNILGLIFSFLSPVYYPLDLLPTALRYLTYIIPTTHIAHLIRVYIGVTNVSDLPVCCHWIILALMIIAFILISLKKARWREM